MTTYDWPKVDQQDLHSRRFARVAAMMREADVGSLILVGPDNIRYATGFRAHLTNESEWFTAVVDSDGQAQISSPTPTRCISIRTPTCPGFERCTRCRRGRLSPPTL